MRVTLSAARRSANGLLLLSLLLLLLTAVMLVKKRVFVIETVRIVGADDQLLSVSEQLLNGALNQNSLDLDMHEWKRQVENLPGVAHARLQRALPTALIVRLYEHEPLARWDGGGLVDVNGERYQAAADAALPIFKGEDGVAELMADFYFDAVLILRDSGVIAQLELLPRGDWRLFLRDGVALYLGQDAPRKRLRLFASYAQQLRRRFPQLHVVDLNYERGFAVSVHPTEEPDEEQKI